MSDEDNAKSVQIMIRAARQGGFVVGLNREPDPAEPGLGVWHGGPGAGRIPTEDTRRRLGDVIFAGEAGPTLLEVAKSDVHHRIVLDLPPDKSVASLTWEAALPPDGEDWAGIQPIALWKKASVVRRTSSYDRAGPTEALFPRIPGASFVLDGRDASPRGSLAAACSPLDFQDRPFDFQTAPWNRTLQFAGDWFGKCDVLHFVGHATETQLVLDGADVDWEQGIEPNLKSHAPRFVFLEACSTAGATDEFRISLAWKISQKVPGVLAMLSRIPTDAANVFTHSFYKEVAAGSPIDFAVQRARIALSAEYQDWMLPVLYLSTPGSAAIPWVAAAEDRPAIQQEHEPLAVIQASGSGGIVTNEVVWRSASFSTPRLPRRARPGYAPGAVLSAAGDVAVSWGADSLQVWHGGTASSPDPKFPLVDARPTLLSVRTMHGAMLQVVTRNDSGVLSWVRGRGGAWGTPERLLDGTSIVGGVLLDDGFLAATAGGAVEGGPSVSIPEGVNELECVAGIDAVSIGDTDIVAVWGKDWEGEGTVRVFVRYLSDGPEWRDIALGADLPSPARLGLLRVPGSSRRWPRLMSPCYGLIVQDEGTGKLVSLDLSGAVRS